MAKKWAIADGPPLKVRLVKETESCQDTERLIDRTPRVRAIGRRIVKMLLALWVMSVGWMLQACYHGAKATDADEPHDAIDGHDPMRGI